MKCESGQRFFSLGESVYMAHTVSMLHLHQNHTNGYREIWTGCAKCNAMFLLRCSLLPSARHQNVFQSDLGVNDKLQRDSFSPGIRFRQRGRLY